MEAVWVAVIAITISSMECMLDYVYIHVNMMNILHLLVNVFLIVKVFLQRKRVDGINFVKAPVPM